MRRFAFWLLARAVRDPVELDMIAGDLEEEWRRHGAWWRWRAVGSITTHAWLRRAPGSPPSARTLMRTILFDVRYAWRRLMKRPHVTVTVACTLALGLGANAAVFNLIDRIVLRPYPLPDPDRAVLLAETGPSLDFKQESVSPANFLDWRLHASSVTRMSAFRWWDANLIDPDGPERIPGFRVSAGFFEALGVRPSLGRGFVHDDETAGRNHVVVLSDALWTRRFEADPAIVGRRVLVDGEPHEVIGIAPPRFGFPLGAEIWAPLSFDPSKAPSRTARNLTVIGRLAEGRTLEQAQAEMAVMADRLAREYPDANRDHGVRVYTLSQGMLDEGTGPILGLWQVSALIVLLIACANIANLLLARAAERHREMAVRLALGASRIRLVRELFTESVLLALLSVPGALLFASVCLRLMRDSMPARVIRFVPGFESVGVDWRLLAVTLMLALGTACVFGVLPALQSARANVAHSLKEGGRSATGRQILRRSIVVAEMSIVLPLLVAAGLGLFGTYRFLDGPQGYDPEGLLTMKVVLADRTYADDAARRRFVDRATDALDAVPGSLAAAAVSNLPAGGSNSTRTIDVEGHPSPDPKNLPEVDYRAVTAQYFDVMRIPIRNGRAFTRADRDRSAPVSIVSESMARKYWPGEDPVGRRVRLHDGTWTTVVGICGDIIHDWFISRNVPTLYRPMDQSPTSYFGLAVRTSGDPDAIAAASRRALLGIDAAQPVFEMMPMHVQLKERTIGLRFLASIMTVLAGLALILAAVGLYAVIAYFVAQRRHEIGIRIALGASGSDIVRQTAGQALRLALAGTAIGLGFSIALSHVIESAVLGLATSSAGLFAGFSALLIGTALVAGYIPARRAAATDPVCVLREQ